MLLNCGIREDSWESLGLQRDQTMGLLHCRQILYCLNWSSNTLVKNWLIGKDPYAGKDWRQEEKGTIEVELVRWCHWLDGHEFKQALGVGDEQRSLVCCSPCGRKESDTTEQLNWLNWESSCEEPGRLQFMQSQNWTWLSNWAHSVFLHCSPQGDVDLNHVSTSCPKSSQESTLCSSAKFDSQLSQIPLLWHVSL